MFKNKMWQEDSQAYLSASKLISIHKIYLHKLLNLIDSQDTKVYVNLCCDPHGSALISVGWIRIRVQEGRNDPQN